MIQYGQGPGGSVIVTDTETGAVALLVPDWYARRALVRDNEGFTTDELQDAVKDYWPHLEVTGSDPSGL